jgi:beta-glucosidase
VQGEDRDGRRTEAVAKHFVGSHHTEGAIHGAHCDVPERLLVEVYGKPFQAAITEAGLLGVMPSYNSVGGEPVSASVRLLTTLLRQQMGFDGLVVSDYNAVANLHTVQRVAESAAHAGLAALGAGMDVEQHIPYGFGPELRDWFEQGRADVSLLDRAVRQVLIAKFRMGLFENPFAPDPAQRDRSFGASADTALAVQSARESLVMLRNDGTLPLRKDVRTLAVIGCHAASARFFFGGYTHYSMAKANSQPTRQWPASRHAATTSRPSRHHPRHNDRGIRRPAFESCCRVSVPASAASWTSSAPGCRTPR